MTTLSKRNKAIREKVAVGKTYPLETAIRLVKECATAKFNECVDVAVNLGINLQKSEAVRGATLLPHGTGRQVRVAVFATEAYVEIAQQAGADRVGLDDLAEDIKKGVMDFDVVIAMPDTMRVVGQLGQILGPRGLMPNPKIGTVAQDVAQAVKNAKQGQVRYRTDKGGVIHCTIGKAAFAEQALRENLEVLLLDLRKNKPSTSKGTYLKKLTLSSTMGPGVV